MEGRRPLSVRRSGVARFQDPDSLPGGPSDGASDTVLVDRGDRPRRPFRQLTAKIFAPVDREQLVFLSERDGRAHLYLSDVPSGKLAGQLTCGAWSVVDLTAVDPRNRAVFFSATGREPGRDPYLRHFYRVSLQGGQPLLLTPEAADHEVHLSLTLGAFVDVYSALSQAPSIVLRESTGALRSELLANRPQAHNRPRLGCAGAFPRHGRRWEYGSTRHALSAADEQGKQPAPNHRFDLRRAAQF
ncbi:MAG: hypothetical protein EOR33_32975 [Mesorhizobium sp.]|nr:MAG: hypothetical protein EOR33_32975 [Mesorhizobium sp.]TIO74069.1 MAG: hypothetical protein E5X75_25545 [Mesorhizobium sp.]